MKILIEIDCAGLDFEGDPLYEAGTLLEQVASDMMHPTDPDARPQSYGIAGPSTGERVGAVRFAGWRARS